MNIINKWWTVQKHNGVCWCQSEMRDAPVTMKTLLMKAVSGARHTVNCCWCWWNQLWWCNVARMRWVSRMIIMSRARELWRLVKDRWQCCEWEMLMTMTDCRRSCHVTCMAFADVCLFEILQRVTVVKFGIRLNYLLICSLWFSVASFSSNALRLALFCRCGDTQSIWSDAC